jgi:hypothetical protein
MFGYRCKVGNELSPDSKITLGYIQGIAKMLLGAGAVAVVTVVARLLGRDTIKISVFSLEIPLGAVAVVFVVGTAAHLFWTCFLISALQRVAGDSDPDSWEESKKLFDEIRSSDSRMLRGMVPRTERSGPGSRLVQMSLGDPTTWLAVGLSVVVVAAILPWRIDDGLKWGDGQALALQVVTCVVVVVLNWWAGGLWAIGVSRLTTEVGFDRFRIFEGSTVFTSQASTSRAGLVFGSVVAFAPLLAVAVATLT